MKPGRTRSHRRTRNYSVASRLRLMRRRRGLQIADVRAVTGWPAAHIEALESGAIAPLLSEVVTLAWLYGTNPERLRPDAPMRKREAGRSASGTRHRDATRFEDVS